MINRHNSWNRRRSRPLPLSSDGGLRVLLPFGKIVPAVGSLLCLASVAHGQALTWDRSLAIAWKQSPAIKAAEYARQIAQVGADRGKPVSRPTLSATASGTVQGPRVTFPRPDNSFATVLPEEYGRVSLVLEQPLYSAGFGAAKERYAAMSSLAGLDYRKALTDVALSVRKAYLDVLKAESGLRSAQEGLTASQNYQSLVQRQVDAGVAKPVDAQTVLSQVAEAQSGIGQATGAVALAKLAFNRAIGRPLQTEVELDPAGDPPAVPDSPDAGIASALRNRTERLGLTQDLIAARAGGALARAQSQPALFARGEVAEQTPSAFLHEHYAAATLEIRWQILDGGRSRLDAREATAQTGRIQALIEDTEQGLALDVTQAWQRMREAKERIALTHIRRNAAAATATVAGKAYEVGRGTAQEMQAALREVKDAAEREIQATYDLWSAAADFRYAEGTLVALPVENDVRRKAK